VRDGRQDEALKVFERVLVLEPRQAQASFNLAALYSARNEKQKALHLLEGLSGITTQNRVPKTADPELLFVLTKAYAAAAQPRDAVRIAEILEIQKPDDNRFLFNLGLILAEAGEYQKAASLFEKVNERVPGKFEVLYNLGVAYYNLNQLDKSRTLLQAALNLNPNTAEVFYRLGLIALARNENENAVGLWLKAIELNPNFHEANFLIAEELFKRQAYVGAQPFYEKAALGQPENLLYQIRLVVTYIRLQQYDKARAVLGVQGKKYADNLNLTYLNGFLARAEGNYDDAITAFDKVLKMSPNNADALSNLGFLLSERGQFENAEIFLRRAIKQDAKIFTAHYELGRLLLREKRLDEAVIMLERGAGLNKQDPGVRYQLFIAYSRLKQKDKADANFAEFKRLEKSQGGTGAAASLGDKKDEIPVSVGQIKP